MENENENENGYMLLFRGNEWMKQLSPEEMQKAFEDWMAWFNGLMEDGRAIAGNPLEKEARTLAYDGEKITTDGSYIESKEAVAGYFMLTVKTFDEAEEIARNCPGLKYGSVVEVRPVAAACPMSELVKATSSAAQES